MPLVTSTTRLNKLKFGVPPSTDRKNGGNSSQPYITTRIPGVDYNDPTQTFEQVLLGVELYPLLGLLRMLVD